MRPDESPSPDQAQVGEALLKGIACAGVPILTNRETADILVDAFTRYRGDSWLKRKLGIGMRDEDRARVCEVLFAGSSWIVYMTAMRTLGDVARCNAWNGGYFKWIYDIVGHDPVPAWAEIEAGMSELQTKTLGGVLGRAVCEAIPGVWPDPQAFVFAMTMISKGAIADAEAVNGLLRLQHISPKDAAVVARNGRSIANIRERLYCDLWTNGNGARKLFSCPQVT